MSEENVELVRLGWDAFGRGDVESMQRTCQPDVVIVQPRELPDSKSYEGLAGVAESIEDWPRQWEDFLLEVVEVIDASDTQLVSVTRQRGRGRESRIEMDFEIAFLHTIRDGKLSRLEMFLSREEALEAVGLTE
jgi:ketosteroid isomerase-like protein